MLLVRLPYLLLSMFLVVRLVHADNADIRELFDPQNASVVDKGETIRKCSRTRELSAFENYESLRVEVRRDHLVVNGEKWLVLEVSDKGVLAARHRRGRSGYQLTLMLREFDADLVLERRLAEKLLCASARRFTKRR